jgi:hypothetical protein
MATVSKTAQRQLDVDHIAEVLDAELAAAGERMQSAERSLTRARQRYAQLIEARTALRGLV